jgi:hypothetical protein
MSQRFVQVGRRADKNEGRQQATEMNQLIITKHGR